MNILNIAFTGLIAAVLSTSAGKAAADQVTIEFPKGPCENIIGSDFSTPTSESIYYVFELHCQDHVGQHRVFITQWNTTATLFGFGRAYTPTEILLVPGDVQTLEVK